MSRDETTRSVELLERWIRRIESACADIVDLGEILSVSGEMRQRWLELLRKEGAQ